MIDNEVMPDRSRKRPFACRPIVRGFIMPTPEPLVADEILPPCTTADSEEE